MIGSTIRGYRIVTELGSGGMGTVYFAEHATIGRRAAIKILNRDISSDEAMVTRFFNEARSVNAIRHPNIVDITDFGEFENTFFIIMEFLEGETLGERMERKKTLEESTVRDVLGQVAAAVGAVHQKGIIHRDLKPENVFLTNHPDYRDFVKVLDFGLVKMPENTKNTEPGLIMGTPAYMSPEQCRAETTIDARTDVYALGAMAFEMLSGRTVFEGELIEQLHAQIHDQPPSLRELSPGTSDELATLVMQCLKKRPEDRPASMREVRDQLRGATASALPASPSPQTSPTAAPTKTFVTRQPAVASSAPTKQERIEREQTERVSGKLGQIIANRLSANTLVLPSPPTAAMKCLELLTHPDCKFSDLAAILEKDPLMGSKLLRLVNSAFYGARGKISSIDAAVSRLGIRNLKLILQEMSVETVFTSRNPRIQGAFRAIWAHCLAVGHLARGVAAALPGSVDPDLAYISGLVHDIGKPVVAVLLLEAERGLADEDRQWMTESLWLKTVNASHRQVGETLARSWKFPAELIEVIKAKPDYDTLLGIKSAPNIVRFANALAKCEGHYLGPLDVQDAMATVLAGRSLLGVDEKLEATLTADLSKKLDETTSAI